MPSRLRAKASGRRDSNPRHSAWKADALPTELHPHFSVVRRVRRERRTHAVVASGHSRASRASSAFPLCPSGGGRIRTFVGDRKSTRLNSSHGYISYAVFCLKKKQTYKAETERPDATTVMLAGIARCYGL